MSESGQQSSKPTYEHVVQNSEAEEGESGNVPLPFTFVKQHKVLADPIEGNQAQLNHVGDLHLHVLLEIRRYYGVPLLLKKVSENDFNTLLSQVYHSGTGTAIEAAADIPDDLNLDQVVQQLAEPEDLLESNDDAPIIRLINALLTEAIKENASDIHIEPFEARLSVRFRIDGVMRVVLQPARSLAPLLISRIKVMSKLDIAEKRLPQDGRISLKVAGRPVDVRVSTMPSGNGERVVMRLLDKQAGKLDLFHLGMADDIQNKMDRLIHHPHGIILVTGPTGSGKTTTLYASLTRLNNDQRNIMTVEDPIEYFLDGIGQTQVNTKVDMSFARGLRAILRQDPDVVMIGEIRDVETAEIAIQSALTGHLVLSTLHTNSAVGAVTRLRDMGVEPFLLSSTITGVLSQRLVRVLCKQCCKRTLVSEKAALDIGLKIDRPFEVNEPEGCPACNHTGYKGRTGVYELLVLDEHFRHMVHKGVDEQALLEYAAPMNNSLWEDGLRLVREGITSLDELMRVTQAKA